MQFSHETILQIARLARLHLSDEEIEQYRSQLGAILEYVAKLQELNTGDVPEFQHAASAVNIFREDRVKSCAEEVRQRAIKNFTHRSGDLLKVQAVFDNRTE